MNVPAKSTSTADHIEYNVSWVKPHAPSRLGAMTAQGCAAG